MARNNVFPLYARPPVPMTFAPMSFSISAARRRAHGFSLIELLVSMLIGLLFTLAVVSALVVGESHKRTTSATSDMDASGAYAASMIDGLVRSAGSGLMRSGALTGVIGCPLTAGNLLPSAQAFPAPFDQFLNGNPSSLAVAPVLIAKNQSDAGTGLAADPSDVLVVMSGSGAAGGVPRSLAATAGTATQINLNNTVGINAGDLVMLSGGAGCIIEPVASSSGSVTETSLTLGGTLYANPNNLAATLAAGTGYVTPLGNPASVQFYLLGVDANNTLYSYDLLQISSAMPQALAANVMELHALYGLDTVGDGKLHVWADPGLGNGYDIRTMMSNSASQLQQIVAIRVALVLKSSLYEKCPVTASTQAWAATQACPNAPAAPPTWFNADPNPAITQPTVTPQTLSLNPDSAPDTHYRYRVIEFVVPVRNGLLTQSR